MQLPLEGVSHKVASDGWRAHHVISHVVTDVQALDVAVFAELLEQILIKVLVMLLDLTRVHALVSLATGSRKVGPLIHVGEEKGGADGWPAS